MSNKPTPKGQKRPNPIQTPESLRKTLRRLNLMIPVDTIGLCLCIGSLLIDGYDTLLCSLTGLLGVQLLFFITIRHDTKQQLQIAEEFEKENGI